MTNQFLFLQYLLFMDPSIGLNIDKQGPASFISKSETKTPVFNRVCSSLIPEDQEVIDVAADFKATPYVWVVDAVDKEAIYALQKSGMVYECCEPAMVLDLATIKPEKINPDILISEVNLKSAEMKTWLYNVWLSKKGSLSDLQQFFEKLQSQAFCSIKLYQGLYQGVPVSTCMAVWHADGVASIHWVSTLPDFQGKGCGYAITHKALLDAKNNGCKQAVLLSTKQGASLYKRLGFQEYAVYNYYRNGSFYLIYRMIVNKVYKAFGFGQKSVLRQVA